MQQAGGPHGTSDFCDWVLDGTLGLADDQDITFTDAYELLQYMEREKNPLSKNPFKWVVDSISEILDYFPR